MLDGTHELNSTSHLFPSVPQYNLPALRRVLMKNQAFRDNAALAKTYLGLSDGVLGAMVRRTTR